MLPTIAATITSLLTLGTSAMPDGDKALLPRQNDNDTEIAQIQAYTYTECNPFNYDGFVWVNASDIPPDDCIVLAEFFDSTEAVLSLATVEVASDCTGREPNLI